MKPKRFVKPKFDQIGKEKNLLLILQFGAISSCQVHKNNFVLIVFIVIITEHTVLKGKKNSSNRIHGSEKLKLCCAYKFYSPRTTHVYESFARSTNYLIQINSKIFFILYAYNTTAIPYFFYSKTSSELYVNGEKKTQNFTPGSIRSTRKKNHLKLF